MSVDHERAEAEVEKYTFPSLSISDKVKTRRRGNISQISFPSNFLTPFFYDDGNFYVKYKKFI